MFYFVGAILRRLFFLSPLLNKNAMQCKNENKKMAEKSLYDKCKYIVNNSYKPQSFQPVFCICLWSEEQHLIFTVCFTALSKPTSNDPINSRRMKSSPLISDAVSLG